jgi:uncharacterized protein (DUF4415 family)
MTKDVSSQRGHRNHGKDAHGGEPSVRARKNPKAETAARTDWERHAASDAEIRAGIDADADAHPTDGAFWDNAKVVWPASKQVVTMRLDADLLEWLRQERGYQTRINAILRSYMDARKKRA